MLSDTLLDSSPTREPVLHGKHWLIAAAACVAGFCLGWFALPLVETVQTKVLATQALLLAAAFFLFALMLVYVYADSRHLKLRTGPWMALTLTFNIGGFIAYLFYSAARTGNWKRASLPLAYAIEVMVVGVMIIIPLVRSDAVPKAALAIVSIPLPPSGPPRAEAPPRNAVSKVTIQDLEKQPVVIPKAIANLKHPPLPPADTMVEQSGPGFPGVPTIGGFGTMPNMTPTPPPPARPKSHAPKRIRVGTIEQAKLIYGPKPDYPQLAKMARIQGTVRLEAVIATDGTIKDLKVRSGHPLLIKAALEAVEQWRYQPTLLNGEPVEVETEIDVIFALNQ